MKLQGRIERAHKGKRWLGRVPDLDLMVQAHSKAAAVDLLRKSIQALVTDSWFRVRVSIESAGSCSVAANDEVRLVALVLRRLRSREGLTVRQVCKRLKSRSPNAYAQYESGRVAPRVDTLSKLLRALNPEFELGLRVL